MALLLARAERGLTGEQAQVDAVPPGDGDGRVEEPGGEDDRQVGAAVEADHETSLVGSSTLAGMSMRSRKICRAWASA